MHLKSGSYFISLLFNVLDNVIYLNWTSMDFEFKFKNPGAYLTVFR